MSLLLNGGSVSGNGGSFAAFLPVYGLAPLSQSQVYGLPTEEPITRVEVATHTSWIGILALILLVWAFSISRG